MACILLVRHGEVEGNNGPRRSFAGWTDRPLTERGERQAEAIARRLKDEPLRAVYASDLQRARRTAERIAAQHGLSVQCDPALREVNYGEWEGLGDAEMLAGWAELWKQRVADPLNVAPPGGESYAALWARWWPAWQAIVRRHPDDVVAVVGHNGPLRTLLCHLLEAPLGNARSIRIDNAGLSRVEVDAGPLDTAEPARVVVSCINETCHLVGI